LKLILLIKTYRTSSSIPLKLTHWLSFQYWLDLERLLYPTHLPMHDFPG